MAAEILHVIGGLYNPYNYESLTVTNSAVSQCTAATIKVVNATDQAVSDTAARAVVTVETASVRYRYDGTDPTTSEGHLLSSGSVLILLGYQAISQFRVIATSTTATLKVTYEK